MLLVKEYDMSKGETMLSRLATLEQRVAVLEASRNSVSELAKPASKVDWNSLKERYLALKAQGKSVVIRGTTLVVLS
jgi:hypothetical protein